MLSVSQPDKLYMVHGFHPDRENAAELFNPLLCGFSEPVGWTVNTLGGYSIFCYKILRQVLSWPSLPHSVMPDPERQQQELINPRQWNKQANTHNQGYPIYIQPLVWQSRVIIHPFLTAACLICVLHVTVWCTETLPSCQPYCVDAPAPICHCRARFSYRIQSSD